MSEHILKITRKYQVGHPGVVPVTEYDEIYDDLLLLFNSNSVLFHINKGGTAISRPLR